MQPIVRRFNENTYNIVTVYHGSKTPDIQEFKTGLVGREIDQEGYGIYFTENKEEARIHGRYIYTVKLFIRRLASMVKPPKRSQIVTLIKQSPNLKDSLEEWAERPAEAMQMAVNACMQDGNEHECFQNVMRDFYRDSPKQYLDNLKAMGYDGVQVPKFHGVNHYIIFNEDCIEIVEREEIA